MIDDKDKHNLGFLILELVEGTITDEHLETLDRWLDRSAEALSFYCSFFKTSVSLKRNLSCYTLEKENNFTESQLWEALAREEKTAPAIEIRQERPLLDQLTPILRIEKEPRLVTKSMLLVGMVSAAAVLLLTLMVVLKPVRSSVAVLSDSINAEWARMKDVPLNGDVLRQDELTLTRGLAEITFDSGAVVVIEAPAVFELRSTKSMYLDSGKISAYVSSCATGFVVDTPNVSIVDLGTEFGVDVQYDGTCDLLMFTGKANLVIGREGQAKTSQLINANEARNVDGRTGRVRDIAVQGNRFVRRIDSTTGLIWRGQNFDLADVVGAGNGFGSGDYRLALDPAKGTFSAAVPQRAFIQKGGDYMSVPGSPFIDGVFIPDGETGEIKISSQGHVFKGCPDTSNIDRTYGFIQTGGSIATDNIPNDNRKFVLDGVTYDGKDRSIIFMHANVGVTFDLHAVRRSLPDGAVVTQFKALCGISDDAPSGVGKADFRVLVDGQTKFEHLQITLNAPGQLVTVPIGPEDRFLTLVTTDGGDGSYNDYCLFARPVLELE